MEFQNTLLKVRFRKREKRFFIHAEKPDGTQVIAHTNNTGSMRGLLAPGAEIWLSPAQNPKRKLRWTLEIIQTVENEAEGIQGGVLVGVNTIAANGLVHEAMRNNLIPGISPDAEIKPEVKYGSRNSRIDFLVTDHSRGKCWVEVKNVSLVENGHARFPDAPTERGRKHLQELEAMVKAGDRSLLVFCIQRDDAQSVGPADDIDPEYGKLLRKVIAAGVQVVGLVCRVTPDGILSYKNIPIMIK